MVKQTNEIARMHVRLEQSPKTCIEYICMQRSGNNAKKHVHDRKSESPCSHPIGAPAAAARLQYYLARFHSCGLGHISTTSSSNKTGHESDHAKLNLAMVNG